jgi:hypothetical protein
VVFASSDCTSFHAGADRGKMRERITAKKIEATNEIKPEIMTIKCKEIRQIVKDYQVYFPDWISVDNDSLVRASGPVLQGITFYRLSYAAYRPTGFIRVLTLPKACDPLLMELSQELKLRNGADRIIGLQSHKNVISEVVAELRGQILPRMDEPLEPLKVLTIYSKLAMPTLAEAYSLVSLNAYFGYESEALKWIDRYKQLMHEQETHGLISEWERDYEQFLETVTTWLKQGVARERLEMIVEEEKRKLGIPVQD